MWVLISHPVLKTLKHSFQFDPSSLKVDDTRNDTDVGEFEVDQYGFLNITTGV